MAEQIIIIRCNEKMLHAMTTEDFRTHAFFLSLINKTTTPALGEVTGKTMQFFLDNHATVDHIAECEWTKPDADSNDLMAMFNAEHEPTVYTFETTILK